MIAWPWRLNEAKTPCCKTSAKRFASATAVAEECRQLAKTALSASAIKDYLDMEQRWRSLARSYEFAERLSSFTLTYRWPELGWIPGNLCDLSKG